jgi:hypothetical protein
MQVRIQR